MKIEFNAAGSDTLYKSRKDVRALLLSGQKPAIYLEKKESKILISLNKEMTSLCGHISSSDIDAVEEVIFTQPYTATASEIVGTGFKCVIDVKVGAVAPASTLSDIDLEVSRIVADGIDSKENMESKLLYLRKLNATGQSILKILKSYTKYDEESEGRIIRSPKVLYKDTHKIIRRTIAYIAQGRNLLFEGDRGVGKNVETDTLSWLTHRPLFEFSMNSQHDNSSLLGAQTLTVEDGNSIVTFDPSVIVKAIEAGGILVFDEFNTSLGHIMSIMNSLLDDRRRITVPAYKTIDAHPNFLAIATQNRNYTDTFANNEATSDRFVPIVFPTDVDLASILKAKVPTVDEDTLEICVKVFEGIKSSVEAAAIDEKSQTIRGFIDACLGVEMGLEIKEALIDNLANRAVEVDERESIKGIIDLHA